MPNTRGYRKLWGESVVYTLGFTEAKLRAASTRE
jgi:hypothetical protein